MTTNIIYPGLRVQTLHGEQDTDDSGAERQTPIGAWGHIADHSHADHWSVCFPNGARILLTEAELRDTAQYRTSMPQTLEQCAMALKHLQDVNELAYMDPPLDVITQTVVGDPDLMLAAVEQIKQLQACNAKLQATPHDLGQNTAMKQLRSTGIELSFYNGTLWSAVVSFTNWEHSAPGGIEGTIGPRSVGPLAEVVDLAKASAEAIGVSFTGTEHVRPTLYMENDGVGLEVAPPDNWRYLLAEQCQRLGWTPIHKLDEAQPVERQS